MNKLQINTAKFIAITTLMHKNTDIALKIANDLISDNNNHILKLSKIRNNTNIVNIVKFEELNNMLHKIVTYITINDNDSLNDIIEVLVYCVNYTLNAHNINADVLTTA